MGSHRADFSILLCALSNHVKIVLTLLYYNCKSMLVEKLEKNCEETVGARNGCWLILKIIDDSFYTDVYLNSSIITKRVTLQDQSLYRNRSPINFKWWLLYKPYALRYFTLMHLILEQYYCALDFSQKIGLHRVSQKNWLMVIA